MKTFWLLLFVLSLTVIPTRAAPASAQEPGAKAVTFASGAARTRLVELFTSEGCSSCPPAEDWLSGLRDQPQLWKDFVPVSWHVVYWDSLGWPDRFASKAFTARQYALAASWRSDSVYTPCFALDGAEWRVLLAREVPAATAEHAGILRVDYDAEGKARVSFSPNAATRTTAGYEAHLTLLGGGIASDVKAGENAGRILRHEFVALTLANVALKSRDGGWSVEAMLVRPKIAGVKNLALAAWVTRQGELAPVQATGGWLPLAGGF